MAGTFIPMPKSLSSKKAMVNDKCVDDDNCFQYLILAGINVLKSGYQKCRPSQYKQYTYMLYMNGIRTPVPLSQITNFENQNLEISVYEDIIPTRISKFCQKCKYHVNLLMLTDGTKFHYTYVHALSRLVGNRNPHRHKMYVRHYCLHPFNTEDNLNEHVPLCGQHEPQQIVYPTPGKNMLKFDKVHYQLHVPFTVYVNFESFYRKMIIS